MSYKQCIVTHGILMLIDEQGRFASMDFEDMLEIDKIQGIVYKETDDQGRPTELFGLKVQYQDASHEETSQGTVRDSV